MATVPNIVVTIRTVEDGAQERPRAVVIESPYAGIDRLHRATNELYAQRALLDALNRGEAPFASHLLYPQVLDDNRPPERYMGIQGQLAWIDLAKAIAVYVDLGISGGMTEAILYCLRRGYEIELRSLDGAQAEAVDAMLAQAITPADLFRDVRLVGPAGTSGNGYVRPHPDAVVDMLRRDDELGERTGERFLNMEAFPDAPAPSPPPPVARPDGPASSWGGAGNG